MSEKKFKVLIYSDSKTNRVLAVRNSRSTMASIPFEGIDSLAFESQVPVFLKGNSLDYVCKKSSEVIFQKLNLSDRTELILKKKKIEIGILIQINLSLVAHRVKGALKENSNLAKIDEKVLSMVIEERQLLLGRIKRFFNFNLKLINDSTSLNELDGIYKNYTTHYSFGSFSMKAHGAEGI